MNKRFISFFLLFIANFYLIILSDENRVIKTVLDNGLTVLIKQNKLNPTTAIQLWYHVGSKDEQTNEKGLAHLLEHMIFKGTKELLSETDIGAVTNKLSGYCNAFTSYDYTCYVFDLPTRHWKEALPILADCMTNCTFKQDLLNSEFKAVIQELKMYRDNYVSMLCQEMISTIFSDHPYHYPVIGFKQDIWNINSKNLHKFYKKHYKPNNATLVIVGNVDPQIAITEIEKNFGHIKKDPKYKKNEYYFNKDLVSKTITLYRDVKKPSINLSFVIPGAKNKKDFQFDLISTILAKDSSSRLNQKLVEEKKLVNAITSYNYMFIDHGLFFILFEPKKIEDSQEIIDIIIQEINNLIRNGITEKELKTIINKNKLGYYNLLESNHEQAQAIGAAYLATKDENYIYNYFKQDLSNIQNEIKELLVEYFRPNAMHKGYLLPIAEYEKDNLKKLQETNDAEDTKFLCQKIRESEVEPCKYANDVQPLPLEKFNFPKSQKFILKNGIEVFYYNNPNIPTINLILTPKANAEYDSDELPGLYNFTMTVAGKSTEKRTQKEIAEELNSRGITLFFNGDVNMHLLSSEFEEGLKILTEIITCPKFDSEEIEKIRDQILSQLKTFEDDPNSIAFQIIKENIYKNHPYNKNSLGDTESIKKITRDDIVNFYKKYSSPKEAKLAIVGDLSNINLQELLENTLGQWNGPEIEDIKYPELTTIEKKEINHFINRDQVVLCYAGLSINRLHPDYYKLSIFDEIFSNSFDSKLFKLREKTGLFYTIYGSTRFWADLQPGTVGIVATVSLDRLKEAEDLIEKTINKVCDSLTQEEVDKAKNCIIDKIVQYSATNASIASLYQIINRFNLPDDHYEKLSKILEKITLEDVKKAAKSILDNKKMVKIRVGRVN